MDAALAFNDVRHAYGSLLALDGVSFRIDPGQILCLLGPSGCGKTTALRVAAGLERPSAGEVCLAGRSVSGGGRFVPPEERGVGLLFQDYALFPHLNVADNVSFGLRHLPPAVRIQRVETWLARVGLEGRERVYPHMLSGGEQQRIALARALAPEPAVLLLDEPFSNLDTQLRQQVRDQVLHVLKEIGAAALLVTHDPEEALFMGDYIALMTRGRVLQQGSALDLYLAPQTPMVAEFFGEINRLAGRVEGGEVITPFGPVAVLGLADATPVDILIRSEGVHIHSQPLDGETHPQAEVQAVRLLGRSSLIHLQTLPETGFDQHLHIRTHGTSRLKPGMSVWMHLDPELVFVFPAGEAAHGGAS